jgi:3-deoxy-D-manno-octulosonic-acid transferase
VAHPPTPRVHGIAVTPGDFVTQRGAHNPLEPLFSADPQVSDHTKRATDDVDIASLSVDRKEASVS